MKKVIVKASGIEGKGLFAARDIKKGEVIVVWRPKKIVSVKGLKKLPRDEADHTTPTGDGRYIVMGVPERYINHSCNPNSYVKNRKDRAMRKIKKGEEITSDYSINGIDKWKLKCECGAKNCRKVVYGDFFKLPKRLQKKYLPYLEKWFKNKFKEKLEELR